MAYTKRAAKGTLLKIKIESAYVTVEGVKDFSYPRGSADRIEATSQDSTGNRKEYVAGMIDPPSITVPIIWDNKATTGSTTHAALEAAYKAGTSVDCQVTTVDAKTYSFTALVLDMTLDAPVSGLFTNNVVLQPTGAETVGDVA
jgi:predicted secreted protein